MSFIERYIGYAGEEGRKQIEFLDSLPLEKYLVCGNIHNIMYDIQEIGEHKLNPIYFDMDDLEFIAYIEERYPNKYDITRCTRYDEWYEIHKHSDEVCINGVNS